MMDLFRWLHKSAAPPPLPGIAHATLGTLQSGDGKHWTVDTVVTPIAEESISVTLVGTVAGPSEEALLAYEHLCQHWRSVRAASGMEEECFELCQSYLEGSEEETTVRSQAAIWATATPQALWVQDRDTFAVTLTFNWQDPADAHVITLDVVGGTCIGAVIDG